MISSCGKPSSFALVFLLAACGGGVAGSTVPVTIPSAPPQAPAPTPTPTPAPTPTTVSALTQTDARIGPCVNMANHLEAPNEGDWGRPINSTDFRDIAAAGFQTIRLPVRWSNHAGTTPPYAIDPVFMARVADVVAQARAAGLRVILNLHHYDEPGASIFVNPAGETARLAQLWKQIAERFKAESDSMLWFELLNEPHDRLTDSNLLSVLGPALAQVRATNPTRPVVIGGQSWSGIGSLATLPLPDDRYLIATFHYYDPFPFTHQGATWVTPVPPMGVTFGSSADLTELRNNVAKAQDFMIRTGRPLFMGEYGAIDAIPVAQRAAYYKAVRDGFAGIQVDGCVWGYANSFSFRDPASGAWNRPLLNAIGLP